MATPGRACIYRLDQSHPVWEGQIGNVSTPCAPALGAAPLWEQIDLACSDNVANYIKNYIAIKTGGPRV